MCLFMFYLCFRNYERMKNRKREKFSLNTPGNCVLFPSRKISRSNIVNDAIKNQLQKAKHSIFRNLNANQGNGFKLLQFHGKVLMIS